MANLTLITGGSRSGKSAHAQALAQKAGGKVYFLATGQALDQEMAARIARHRAGRPKEFHTVEEPLLVADALDRVAPAADIVIVDCLTLWISNLMGAERNDGQITAEADALAKALHRAPCAGIVVSDEVGSGLVPMDPVGRRFRDLLGWTNQTIAQVADQVLLMVAGYPLRIK